MTFGDAAVLAHVRHNHPYSKHQRELELVCAEQAVWAVQGVQSHSPQDVCSIARGRANELRASDVSDEGDAECRLRRDSMGFCFWALWIDYA
ncbi:hypothetical protein MLD38_035208 [Melastoma candidum]|uniref:Uncharacterized protein n=1 Tax=Melastoma candidum TaxID=119954 RepID=A0ACB9MD08_9MYRT|nr:hypothetical protein MLD38_035208 [Melastoma candidum]